MQSIQFQTNGMISTRCFVDKKEIHGVRSADVHFRVGEVPTAELELLGLPDISTLGDIEFSYSPQSVKEAVMVLRNELLKHGAVYKGFRASIAAALNERGIYTEIALPFEPDTEIAGEILDYIIGSEG